MIFSPNSMLSQLLNPALKKALQHDSAPAGRAAPQQEPQSPWMKAGNCSRSSFEAGPSTRPSPPPGIAYVKTPPPPSGIASLPERASSQSDCRSSFTAGGEQNVQCYAPEVKAQWDAMAKSTPDLRAQLQQVQGQLIVAILRGDSPSISKLTQQLMNLDRAIQARSAPKAATDVLSPAKYETGVKKMNNEQLNTEWNLQSMRSIIAEFRGDKAGAADAKKKLEACNTEVSSRVDNVLAQFMKELEGMSDTEVTEANTEAADGIEGDVEAPASNDVQEPQQEQGGGDDIGKFIASAGEMVARSIEDTMLAPFKAIGSLFGF